MTKTTGTGGNTGSRTTAPLLTIPIFPLRKIVKLPTENITLNLYEPRYLQMMEEAVLNDRDTNSTTATTATTGGMADNTDNHHPIPLFGAIYTTNLPHIVVPTPTSTSQRNTTDTTTITYIVPILEPNMVGSVFIVTNYTRTIQQNGSPIIRLNATAMLRFRIIQLIHTGGYEDLVVERYVDSSNGIQHSRNSKPYIMAQVQLLLSDIDTIFCSMNEIERDVNDCSRSTDNQLPIDINTQQGDFSDTTNVEGAAIPPTLPNYLWNIISQYESSMLSYFAESSDIPLPVLKTAWIRELLLFYNTSLSVDNDDNRVPLYLEQKERLRILSR